MPFSQRTKEELLVRSERRCCLCHKFKGKKIEVHHIVPESEGGDNNFDNGIVLCFDCHEEVGSYNEKHPKGNKFTHRELKKHRDRWLAKCSLNLPTSTHTKIFPVSLKRAHIDRIFKLLRTDDRRPTQQVVAFFMKNDHQIAEELLEVAKNKLDIKDKNIQWKAAFLIEAFIAWEPELVDNATLLYMSQSRNFSVRSSASICYLQLAQCSPGRVPIATVSKLASPNEDWYVYTPARRTLKYLIRTRGVILDILEKWLKSADCEYRMASLEILHDISEKESPLISHLLENKTFMKVGNKLKGEEKKLFNRIRKNIEAKILKPEVKYYAF